MPHAVALREVRESDFETFYQQQSDPESAAMAAFTPRTRDEVIDRWSRMIVDEEITVRTITVDDVAAGHVVSWLDEGHREFGYWVGRQFWGQGVATEAVRLMLEIVRDRPLEAWAAPTNLGSIRVLEKNGFTFDRDQDVYRVFRLEANS